MNEEGQAALRMLRRKLSLLKEDAAQRHRLNLKSYLEECLALTDIIQRNADERTETHRQ